jgi:hypothetical protein
MIYRRVFPVVLFLATTNMMLAQMVPWLTRSADNSRSGWNASETMLTQQSLFNKGIRLQPLVPVVGDARGMEAQPLIVPSVQTAKGMRDVMILPSLANVVRGVDAHDGSAIWQTPPLGVPINGSAQIDMHQINQHWGCLSTGVVSGLRFYTVCWVSMDGSGTPKSGRYFMYVLNVADGSQTTSPVPVQGTDTSMWKQRSSLVLTDVAGVKTIFFAHGSVFETSTGYTGGVTAFDVATNKIVAQLPMTSGIWMAGCGLIADAAGDLYAITGNGDFDPSKGWFGESFIKIHYTAGKGMEIVDQWSPWSDFQRSGQQKVPANKLAGESLPSEEIKPVGGGMSMNLKGAILKATLNEHGIPTVLVYPPPMASGAWSDEDWGSAGPSCIFAISVCIASGKDGIGYPIATTALGKTTSTTVGTQPNYAKLASPCVWLTMSPGQVDCSPDDPRTLNFFPNGVTAHLHMTPVHFYNPVLKQWEIAVWGENSRLHLWAIDAQTKRLTYIAESLEYASTDVRSTTPGGMPGGFCSGSSNGQNPDTYILACSIPYGDGNTTVTQGRLLIYDPIHLDAEGHIRVLWDSQHWGIPYKFNKFMPPVIDGGEIILPNYDGSVMIFR